MEYKNLGSTGLGVSRMCLGTMNFGDSTDEAEGIKLVHAAIDMGINFIDTADVYWKGKSEEILGKAIKGRREGLVIATKCWAPFDEGPNDRGSSRYHIMQAAEGALKRLGVDHIDLFIMHRPDEALPALRENPAPTEETLGALSDLVRQGKVRYIGTSCYPAWKIVEGQLLRYPGDTSLGASAANVINCRCSSVVKPSSFLAIRRKPGFAPLMETIPTEQLLESLG